MEINDKNILFLTDSSWISFHHSYLCLPAYVGCCKLHYFVMLNSSHLLDLETLKRVHGDDVGRSATPCYGGVQTMGGTSRGGKKTPRTEKFWATREATKQEFRSQR